MKERIPLGFIELDSGSKPVYALYDFFLNFTFDKKENWEDLRLIVNILLDAYIKQNPGTVVTLIEDEIIVTTQFKQYLDNLTTPKEQDFKFDEVNIKKLTFMEVQNSASSDPTIDIRATSYSVVNISQNPGRVSNQIWLLAEDVGKLLHGNAFSNYVPKDEVSGKTYPNASGIMFVSLQKLSQEDTVAGELASFLLGKTNDAMSDEVSQIASTLYKSCVEFCNDKGVKGSMSVDEKRRMEGRMEGIEEGLQQGIQQGIQQATARLTELINAGLSVEDALKEVSNGTA